MIEYIVTKYLKGCAQMNYIDGKLVILSNLEIKKIKEWEYDADLFIVLGGRCLNLYLDKLPKHISSRIQLPELEGILIRYCSLGGHDVATIHFLKENDIYSSIMNLEIKYGNHIFEISQEEHSVEMKLTEIKFTEIK